jgi:hypothetical protein
MSIDDWVRAAQHTLTEATAIAVARPYTEQPVFPRQRVIAGPGTFPDWEGSVLLLSVENQGVCAWGLALDGGSAGAVLVGGDLCGGERTAVYCDDLDTFIRTRMWDAGCLDGPALLQAQAKPLDDSTRERLRTRWTELDRTIGWPCDVNLRFEGDGVRLMLWACHDQCDWWIAGDARSLREQLPALLPMSNLQKSLWSNDEIGDRLLDDLR